MGWGNLLLGPCSYCFLILNKAYESGMSSDAGAVNPHKKDRLWLPVWAGASSWANLMQLRTAGQALRFARTAPPRPPLPPPPLPPKSDLWVPKGALSPIRTHEFGAYTDSSPLERAWGCYTGRQWPTSGLLPPGLKA